MALYSVDKNQGPIVKDLRRLGYTVENTAFVGRKIPGFPDILVTGYSHRHQLTMILKVEIKTETGSLTEDQEIYHAEQYERHGNSVPLITASDLDDILRWYGSIWEG